MPNRIDFSALMRDIFTEDRPKDGETPRESDTLPCPDSNESTRATIDALAQSTANNVYFEIPSLEAMQRELLILQFVNRFFHLAKEAASRISFLPMLWEFQDDLEKEDCIVGEVLEIVTRILMDNDFVTPGSEPVEERTWRVVRVQLSNLSSRTSHHLIAENVHTGLRKEVKLYDVLVGLDWE